MKICQFKLEIRMQGGGERVMQALHRTLKAKVYTMLKEVKGEEIEEISSEAERRLVRNIAKTE